MAGKGVRVLTTPTSDLGKILACMHGMVSTLLNWLLFYKEWRGVVMTLILLSFSGLDVGGEINLTAAIQIAQLALKHRQNKNQRQRIIVFAGRYGTLSSSS